MQGNPVEAPVYVAPTKPDGVGRITAPVFVNGRGPYTFVVDTGASRSAISPRTAEQLGLQPDTNRPLNLRGVTGQEMVASLAVASLRAGDIELRDQRLPVVTPRIFANADGILGIDGFAGMCLSVRFVEQRIRIRRGGCSLDDADWTEVTALRTTNGLVAIRTHVGSVRAQAVIDTGAERSLGNLALMHALGLDSEALNPATDTKVFGATPELAHGNVLSAPTILIRDLEIGNLPVTFGDFEVFKLWGLTREPAIVLGMDILGTVDAMEIDYRRSEVRFLPRNASRTPRVRAGDFPTRVR